MVKVGIVTVLYNSETVLEGFLKSLDEQVFTDFVLYIIDNKSPDKSLTIAEELTMKKKFKTEIIPLEQNYGVAYGNNVGIRAALKDKCNYILLANNDITFNPDALSYLIDGIEQNNVSMASAKIYYHNTDMLWYAGGYFNWMCNNIHRGINRKDDARFNKSCIVEFAPSCFLLIKADVFERVGLMDERYFVYYDDTDFIWRATQKGKEKIFYIPKAIVYHKVSNSVKNNSDFTLRQKYKNRHLFIRKNISPAKRLFILAIINVFLMIYAPYIYSKKQMAIIAEALKEGRKLSKFLLIVCHQICL